MTGRERLIVGTRWMLENAKEGCLNMLNYRHPSMSGCGTPSCWLGWLGTCPMLQAEGLRLNVASGAFFFMVGGAEVGYHTEEPMLRFLNLSHCQSEFLFDAEQSGHKADILDRLHTVLKEPGPFPEPEIENLDAEWTDLHGRLLLSTN